ncbi:hypothetical protein BJV78DRAFT_918805 [Lactifluus subvellereus]|nr:hypothetical protein BJV78DRAFT_918805 [Lactifluus subvellereus]
MFASERAEAPDLFGSNPPRHKQIVASLASSLPRVWDAIAQTPNARERAGTNCVSNTTDNRYQRQTTIGELLAPNAVPQLNNLLATPSTRMLLASFVVFPGTFNTFESIETTSGVELLHIMRNVHMYAPPLLFFPSPFSELTSGKNSLPTRHYEVLRNYHPDSIVIGSSGDWYVNTLHGFKFTIRYQKNCYRYTGWIYPFTVVLAMAVASSPLPRLSWCHPCCGRPPCRILAMAVASLSSPGCLGVIVHAAAVARRIASSFIPKSSRHHSHCSRCVIILAMADVALYSMTIELLPY